MKHVIALLFLIISIAAQGGDKVGHGGGIWACVDTLDRLDHGRLIDLYEAAEEYSLEPIQSQSSIQSIVDERAEFLRINLPEYSRIFTPYFKEVNAKIHYVDAVVTPIDDTLYHITPNPKYCAIGKWKYTQFANFTDQGLVLIQKDLWENKQIPNLDKAALIWHEIVYRWLRVEKSDINSVRARQITGILFSTLPPQEMKTRIQIILGGQPTPQSIWMCLTSDRSTNIVYPGTSEIKREAELNSIEACEKTGHGGACDSNSVQCDEITSSVEKQFCEVRDYASGRHYAAKGRSKIEASYNAIKKCYGNTNSPSSCSLQNVICQ